MMSVRSLLLGSAFLATSILLNFDSEAHAQAASSFSLRCNYKFRTVRGQRNAAPAGREARACFYTLLLARTDDSGNAEYGAFTLFQREAGNGTLFRGDYNALITALAAASGQADAERFRDGLFVAAVPAFGLTFGHARG